MDCLSIRALAAQIETEKNWILKIGILIDSLILAVLTVL